MKIKQAVEKVPGGLMVVPLLLGAVLNTIDKLHLPPIQSLLKWLGAPALHPDTGARLKDMSQLPPGSEAVYEFLRIGGFTEPLVKIGALSLIGIFLVCVGSQMNFRVGGRALKKGLLITGTKLGMAVLIGVILGRMFGEFNGFLGLSIVAIIAAMENGNGGMYVALTGQYGNRSDVGAISVISLNDGPFFTLMALGVLGEQFPMIAFIAVLLPMAVGFILGNLDTDIRAFLKPGEQLTIPFFAFALGTLMNLRDFVNPDAIGGGLFLGVATVCLTGIAAAAVLRLSGERSQIAAIAEASTAGNATQTPIAVAQAAAAMAMVARDRADDAVARGAGNAAELLAHAERLAARAAEYDNIYKLATAQVSISTITTALLCPLAVILYDRWQRSRGIDGRLEDPTDPTSL